MTMDYTTETTSFSESVATSLITADLRQVMVSPVFFFYDSLSEGLGSIRNPIDTSLGFSVDIPEGSSDYTRLLSVQGDLDNCRLKQSAKYDGSLTPYTSAITVGDYSVRGRLSLTAVTTYQFERIDESSPSTCSAWVQELEDCYINPIGCSESDADWVRSVFGPLMEAGLWTPDKIHELRSVRFTARYQ
jgi:hypothetical protein